MRKFSILIFIFCSFFIFGQKKKRKVVPPPPPSFDFSNGLNENYKPISFGLRIKNYPFNKATKVKIVSYNLKFAKRTLFEPIPIPRTKEDSVKVSELVNRPKSIDFRDILETQSEKEVEQSKTLNLNEISQLTHILFNTCNKYYINERSQSGCFFPRNAILFYDENDKIFEIMEICFECGGIETYPNKFFDWKESCEYIYPQLEKFFIRNGLTPQYNYR